MIQTRTNICLKSKVLAFLFLVAGMVMLAFASPAWAATFTVTRTDDPNPDGCLQSDCSLREAVITSNSNPGSDTIMLQPTTYKLTNPGGGDSQGDLDVSANLDIKSTGPGRATVDANGIDRAIEVSSGGLSLYDITVQGGLAPTDGDGRARGGGIRVAGALYLYHSEVSGNGLPGNNGDVGGGIFNGGHTVLSRSEVSSNTADTGFGGGIYTAGTGLTEIRDSKFFNNSAEFGGALASSEDGASALVERSQFSYNRAIDLGGADYQLGNSNYSFTNTTINSNTAGAGSGGGAIRVRDGAATLSSSTVTRNNAPNAGGISAQNDSGGTTSVTLHNTILAGNTDSDHSDGDNPDCYDPDALVATHFHTQGYNIVGRVEGCQLHPVTGDHFGTSVSPVDPKLDSSEHFNGGAFIRVFTDALLAGSPAIDGGDPSSGGCPFSDARGVVRPFGERCDIGAYELAKCSTIVVNRVGTFGDDSSTTPELTPTSGADGFLGLDGNDSLKGADGADALCGGTGADTLGGAAGGDTLFGGPGNDVLNGGSGKDHFNGGKNSDVIHARDNQRDVIACGPGTDRVFADQVDKVASDCERVTRG